MNPVKLVLLLYILAQLQVFFNCFYYKNKKLFATKEGNLTALNFGILLS